MGILNRQINLNWTIKGWLVQTGFELHNWGYYLIIPKKGTIEIIQTSLSTWRCMVYKASGLLILDSVLMEEQLIKAISYYLEREKWVLGRLPRLR